jgi:hypothetical protein
MVPKTEPKPKPNYLRQVTLRFDLSDEEEQFCDGLPEDEREQFRLFALGAKDPGTQAWDQCE